MFKIASKTSSYRRVAFVYVRDHMLSRIFERKCMVRSERNTLEFSRVTRVIARTSRKELQIQYTEEVR